MLLQKKRHEIDGFDFIKSRIKMEKFTLIWFFPNQFLKYVTKLSIFDMHLFSLISFGTLL